MIVSHQTAQAILRGDDEIEHPPAPPKVGTVEPVQTGPTAEPVCHVRITDAWPLVRGGHAVRLERCPAPPSGRVTVAGVVDYAGRLRDRADAILRPDSPTHDPWARPPYLTTAAARTLCSRKKGELTRRVEEQARAAGRDPTPDELAEAAAAAPEHALADLRFRWAQWERAHTRSKVDDDDRLQRHVRRQLKACRDRDAARRSQTLGTRLDHALARLSTVPAGGSGRYDAETGGGTDGIPSSAGEPARRARAIARDAVHRVEDELETAQRRRVEDEAA